MAERRSSTTQMAELNATLLAQNEQLKGINRVAQQALGTGNNVQAELYRQKGVIANSLEKNDQIKAELASAARKTNQMRRRSLCIKATLWISLLLLIAANVGLVIFKLAR